METESNRAAQWVVGIVVVAAIIGLVLLARGPTDQDRSGAAAPTAVVSLRA